MRRAGSPSFGAPSPLRRSDTNDTQFKDNQSGVHQNRTTGKAQHRVDLQHVAELGRLERTAAVVLSHEHVGHEQVLQARPGATSEKVTRSKIGALADTMDAISNTLAALRPVQQRRS